jgi:heat shock protein HslJ
MHRLTALLAAGAAVLAVAACGGDDDQGDTTTSEPTTVAPGGDVPGEIVGVHWLFDGYYTVGGLQPLPVADSGAGITIAADGTVAIDTGCNQGSGVATFDGDQVQFGPITVTEKACADDLMQIERMLLGQLAERVHWGLGDHTLSLTPVNVSDSGLRFHDAANPPADDTTTTTTEPTTTEPTTTEPTTTEPTGPTTTPAGDAVPAEIAGVDWVLDGYITIAGLQRLPITDTVAGMTIAADGSVTLDGGCNQGSATATFDGELLQLHDIVATAKACADQGLMQLEQMMFGQLAEPQYWYVADGTLQLTAARISDTGLHFHDATKPPADGPTGDSGATGDPAATSGT